MTNADFPYPTILVIGIREPDTVSDPGFTENRQQLTSAALAFVQAALLESGLSQDYRVTDNGLVALFSGVDAAFETACTLQQAWLERNQGSTSGELRILVDRHEEQANTDTAGDPAEWIKSGWQQLLEPLSPGQILATKAIVRRLDEVSRTRFQVFEHGSAEKPEGDKLYQVICHEETITRIAISTLNQDKTVGPHCLSLRWRDNTATVLPDSPVMTMGRDDQSDIRIDSDLASRIHARLSYQETNFILSDQSTNGTFVKINEDAEVRLHNEQIVLRGRGVISLGRCIHGGHGKLIYFKLNTWREQPD